MKYLNFEIVYKVKRRQVKYLYFHLSKRKKIKGNNQGKCSTKVNR